MELTHPTASWTIEYTDGRASGPQRIESQGSTLLSFVHCRIDGVNDDDLAPKKVRHFHKGGAAIFEGEGIFSQGAPLKLRQVQRVAANTIRMTYDLTWPKDTPLKKGLELGSVVLAGAWKRYFLVTPDATQADWQELPEDSSTVVLSPIPTAIVLEDAKCRRVEWGLGDDLWRWQKGLNGEFLHATGRLELSRNGNRLTLRRYVAFCDAIAEAKAAEALKNDPRFQGKPDEDGNYPEPKVPTSQPEARNYRFSAYMAWNEPDLVVDYSLAEKATPVAIDPKAGLNRVALEALGEAPCLKLDMAALPVDANARRNGDKNALPCWESRTTLACYKKALRQLAEYAKEGTLVLENFTPGWCNVASHETRKANADHWDLPAMLETMVWTRQLLGEGWTILAPQKDIFLEMPSLEALGTTSGFRNEDLD